MQELADRAGIGKATLDRYERGLRVPRLTVLAQIAAALDVPLATLVREAVATAEAVA